MKNTFGNAVTLTLFGESHGSVIGAVLDGLSSGIKIDEQFIKDKLSLRRPSGDISTKRVEADEFEILSGVFNGYTTGTPLCIVIKNTNTKSKDYSEVSRLMRPSHADLTAYYRYGGYEDYRGGGHFSGRITAALVAACSVLQYALEQKGIFIGTHIKSLATINDRKFADLKEDIDALSRLVFPVLSEESAEKMKQEIVDASKQLDSVGGILETAVIGLPAGIGEPWFDTVEGLISHAVFSVPGVKGIEFGAGFDITKMRGSFANDQLEIKDEAIISKTNHSGGINGGITNGMPIIFRTAVKPTPSIFKAQQTVDIKSMQNATLELKGRHDPAIVHRARAVVDAVTALTIADMLTVSFGNSFLGE